MTAKVDPSDRTDLQRTLILPATVNPQQLLQITVGPASIHGGAIFTQFQVDALFLGVASSPLHGARVAARTSSLVHVAQTRKILLTLSTDI